MEHVVKSGELLSKIAAGYGITLNRLLAANPRFKADPDRLAIGDQLLIPTNAIESKAPSTSDVITDKQTVSDDDFFVVSAGQITFDAEGLETPGIYFSRVPHVPGAWSGVTIGRGYDMGSRSEDEITEDLSNSGIPLDTARNLARCRGMKGEKAKAFLESEGLTELEITPAAQKALFMLAYQELVGDVLRICTKHDVVQKYGATDWDKLNPLIRDIAIDMRYRGDYTSATRERFQPVLVSNYLDGLKTLIADQDYWVSLGSVPMDRFRRRNEYVLS